MGGPLNRAGRFGEEVRLASARNPSDIITDLFLSKNFSLLFADYHYYYYHHHH
jgi:hypothetical protein